LAQKVLCLFIKREYIRTTNNFSVRKRSENIAKQILTATSLAVVVGFIVVVVIIIPATQGGGWY
jgi:hypothetical protein